MERASLIISGMVQGVFFRAFTRDVALRFGLKGWVRNLPGGQVEALFEGDREAIENAIGICRVGPPASRVEDIEVVWEKFKGEYADFSIRHF